jgi:hypothetical protein
MDCACGLNRAINRSGASWDGQSTKFEAIEPSGGIGNWSAVPSPFAGITTVTLSTSQIQLPERSCCQMASPQEQPPEIVSGVGEKNQPADAPAATSLLAASTPKGKSLVGTMGDAAALLARLVCTASPSSTSAVT